MGIDVARLHCAGR